MGSSEGSLQVESVLHLSIWQQLHSTAYVAVLLINHIAGNSCKFKYDFQQDSGKTMAFFLLEAN